MECKAKFNILPNSVAIQPEDLASPVSKFMSRGSAVGILATGWTTEGSEFESPVESITLTSSRRPDRFRGPPNLLSVDSGNKAARA
jgi:hypothetical protein